MGLNVSNTGDTQIELGESGNMDNFYITDDFKLKKIYGYKSFYDFESPILGMYYTNLSGTEYLLVAASSKLYYFLKSELEDPDVIDSIEPTLIGNIGNDDASFFTFDNKVYILSGKYQSWDGTTLEEVVGYTPLVFINTPPAGGGLIYDEINMLNPQKHQTFNGDGTSKTYHLAQNGQTTGIDIHSIDKVIVGEVELNSTDYTYDLHYGTVTFTTAPPQGMDNVDIYWTLN